MMIIVFLFGLLFSLQAEVSIPINDDVASKLITVMTSTSPIPSHPSTKLLYEAQESLMRIPALKKSKKIIVFDEIKPGNEHLKEKYEQYKKNVIELTKTDPVFANTELVFSNSWNHLSGSVKNGMQSVRTPFVLMHQHDLVLKKWFDLNGLLATMLVNPRIKYVHFWGGNNTDEWYNGPVDNKVEGIHYVPLCRSFGWSDQTHVASTNYYCTFVLPKCSKCFMEKVLHPALKSAIKQDGLDAGHQRFGTYLYGGLKNGHFIHHTDGAHS